jgi:hypothetical protein
MRKILTIAVLFMTLHANRQAAAAPQWQPTGDQIKTAWAEQVDPVSPLAEYPRPQLVRKQWTNLNGLWDYAISERDVRQPSAFAGKILVPFPVESSLSGVQKTLSPEQVLWYHREFEAQKPADGGRVLLNFDAVDWHAEVSVNGKLVGTHEGGYDPFSMDITDVLNDGGKQQVQVKVVDATDNSDQPRGKQQLKPGGIWYTAVSGIWQTVWLETVPKDYISGLKIIPDVDKGTVSVSVASSAGKVAVSVLDNGREIASINGKAGERLTLKLKSPVLWSPDAPHLYQLKVTAGEDTVESYFGLRKISVVKDGHGVNRLALNNQVLFQYGPLDQGWWPDGLYTAPTDGALRWDIEQMKAMGFNMVRKHAKVEPARWYYWCDKLGLLVWQDMPSIINHNFPEKSQHAMDGGFRPGVATIYRRELKAMLDHLYNHPSIVVWVPFNEGWGEPGEKDTNAILNWVKQYDATRLVDGPSGWVDYGVGDMRDMHKYPGPGMFPVMEQRVSVLGEFGGLGLPVSGHMWVETKKNWGYQSFANDEELKNRYAQLMINLRRLQGRGLAAAVYTQLTDVETESNGIYTYDRKVAKLPVSWLATEHKKLYEPLPEVSVHVVLPTSRLQAQDWRYTLSRPDENWSSPSFDNSSWKSGAAGFGGGNPPNVTINTKWTTEDIWLRRNFELKDLVFGGLTVLIYHDEDAEVYINGTKVLETKGYITDYDEWPISVRMLKVLKLGINSIAVHCHQTKGGQYIDIGLQTETLISR